MLQMLHACMHACSDESMQRSCACSLLLIWWCRAADQEHLSPFSVGAQRLGYQHLGGKMDGERSLLLFVHAFIPVLL